jgi:hypothetical protein
MSRGVRRYLVGSLVLIALAGCGRSILQYAQREPWRSEAEAACLRSGVLKESATVVRIEPIEGPGICGADYPLKVAVLGESSAFGFADDAPRPPGAIPRSSSAQQPRWPIATRRQNGVPTPPEPRSVPQPAEPRYASPSPVPQSQYATPGAPLSINPPGIDPQASVPDPAYPYPQRPAYGAPAYPQNPSAQRPAAAPADDDEDDPARGPASIPSAPGSPPPALGPARAPRVTGTVPVEIKPTATLACPIASALDNWITSAVQPAAQRWFGQPVVALKQISAYSCRGMNGQVGARISEHAFGNALDIAAFELADGRRITVKNGWRGSPAEQGFLRDVQGAACEQFTTVLAPGSNRFHYDHIHVDLMRRASGRRICNPGAVDGELVAARARREPTLVAARPEPPPLRRYDPPFDGRNDPFAWRGDASRRGDPAVTGSVKPRRPSARKPSEDDDDWIEDDGPRVSTE